jgi:hypothetical protein
MMATPNLDNSGVPQAPIHDMHLTHTKEDGSTLWTCPKCGKVIAFDKDGQMKTIKIGDGSALHSGSAGITISIQTYQDDMEQWTREQEMRDLINAALDGIDI